MYFISFHSLYGIGTEYKASSVKQRFPSGLFDFKKSTILRATDFLDCLNDRLSNEIACAVECG
jgi:hypothetical protein